MLQNRHRKSLKTPKINGSDIEQDNDDLRILEIQSAEKVLAEYPLVAFLVKFNDNKSKVVGKLWDIGDDVFRSQLICEIVDNNVQNDFTAMHMVFSKYLEYKIENGFENVSINNEIRNTIDLKAAIDNTVVTIGKVLIDMNKVGAGRLPFNITIEPKNVRPLLEPMITTKEIDTWISQL